MKKIFLLFVVLFSVANSFAQQASIEKLFKLKFDTKKEIPAAELTMIFHILVHTCENNIHKMRSETDKQTAVFI